MPLLVGTAGSGLFEAQDNFTEVICRSEGCGEYSTEVIQRKAPVLSGSLLVLVFFSICYVLWSGSVNLTLSEVISTLTGTGTRLNNTILLDIRIPRLLAGILGGFGLAVVGSVFQTLLRNPIAEPYVLGVSSGAGVGGSLVLLTGIGGMGGGIFLTCGGVIGGIASLALVLAISGWFKKSDVVQLILSGVVVGSMLASITTLILVMGGKDTNVVLRWLLGSLTPMNWERLAVMGILVLISSAIWWNLSRKLNAFAFSEELAGRLGINSKSFLAWQLVIGSFVVGSIVGSVGIIGFIGLVAPHIARRIVGPDLRNSLVLSGNFGATLLVISDFLAQKALNGIELPVGAVTAVLGAPVLLILLRRSVYRV